MPKSADEIEILHDRKHGKAAQFLKSLFAHEDPLVAIGHLEDAGANVRRPFNHSKAPAGSVDAEPEGAADDPGLLHFRPDSG
jgi:hypothetical protein